MCYSLHHVCSFVFVVFHVCSCLLLFVLRMVVWVFFPAMVTEGVLVLWQPVSTVLWNCVVGMCTLGSLWKLYTETIYM